MRIVVVCGAGASSTFVALRLQRAAAAARLNYEVAGSTESALAEDLQFTDLLLVGPHLGEQVEAISARAAEHQVPTILLPDDVFGDADGTRTLRLVQEGAS